MEVIHKKIGERQAQIEMESWIYRGSLAGITVWI